MRSPSQLLTELDFRPSRMLGQNFLKYPEITQKILEWAELDPNHFIVEVGPGLGALTETLLSTGQQFIAIEKDKRLHAFLKTEYENLQNFKVICGDALEVDFLNLGQDILVPIHLFSNLPYSISTPLVETFLRARSKLKTMTLLVQEEVALRMAADHNDSNYGRLSIWIQTLCTTKIGPRIPKKAFMPEPKVESRLIQLKVREQSLIPEESIEPFLKFIAGVFQFRRKMLRKSIEHITKSKPHLNSTSAERFLALRPEQMTILELFELFNALESIVKSRPEAK